MSKALQEMTNEELWRLFPIMLTEHQHKWLTDFALEKELLMQCVGEKNIARISHIGSTAVPGLIAKPTVDILLEITQGTDIEWLKTKLEKLGYLFSPQPNKPPPHMMFMKGYTPNGFSAKVFHLHVRYLGDWDEFYFRDYLIAHPEAADEYGRLKILLKERYEHDRDGYTSAKTDFVKTITILAHEEFLDKYATQY